ncbi:hypothetical protein EIN_381280 [Entamoeba invadens IP1]|uniref:Importin subunit alpha-1 n=1 Tax=Entamoeba invadens IP1 TaxID=370355 RepID=A0A0A1UEE3_ENTIV|nr:hypothetical protein EIN_381280 [Entamoeba invadens IP1]ELP92161.1 hypothetical protein EIN_381280 [Entamoeba invadens IP1]|eukprot:XP_004258932.1 hypothetical protein EIN_381280 [Entamoeba invadens IP1]
MNNGRKGGTLEDLCFRRREDTSLLRSKRREEMMKVQRGMYSGSLVSETTMKDFLMELDCAQGKDEITQIEVLKKVSVSLGDENVILQIDIDQMVKHLKHFIETSANLEIIKLTLICLSSLSIHKRCLDTLIQNGCQFDVFNAIQTSSGDIVNIGVTTLANLVFDDVSVRDQLISMKLIEMLSTKLVDLRTLSYLYECLLQTTPLMSIKNVMKLIPMISTFVTEKVGYSCVRNILHYESLHLDMNIVEIIREVHKEAWVDRDAFKCIGNVYAYKHTQLVTMFLDETFSLIKMVSTNFLEEMSQATFVDEEFLRTFLWVCGNIVACTQELQTNQAEAVLSQFIDSPICCVLVLSILKQNASVAREAFKTLSTVISVSQNIPLCISKLGEIPDFFDVFQVIFNVISDLEDILDFFQVLFIVVSTRNMDWINKLNQLNVFQTLQNYTTHTNLQIAGMAQNIIRVGVMCSEDGFEL